MANAVFSNYPFTREEFRLLCKAYGNKCVRCGVMHKKLQADHVISESKGGSHELWNIQPLCRSCNCKKGSDSTDYRPDAGEKARLLYILQCQYYDTLRLFARE